MSNPNLFNTQSILGKTALSNVTTTVATVVSNSVSSNALYKINSIVFSNASSSDATVRAELLRNTLSYYIAYDITVPPRASLMACGRDHSFYLEEGDAIRVLSSSDTGITSIVSYDILS